MKRRSPHDAIVQDFCEALANDNHIQRTLLDEMNDMVKKFEMCRKRRLGAQRQFHRKIFSRLISHARGNLTRVPDIRSSQLRTRSAILKSEEKMWRSPKREKEQPREETDDCSIIRCSTLTGVHHEQRK